MSDISVKLFGSVVQEEILFKNSTYLKLWQPFGLVQ